MDVIKVSIFGKGVVRITVQPLLAEFS